MKIRPILKHEHGFLSEMLYEALFVVEGKPKFQKSILKDDSISKYIEEFGRNEFDIGLVVEDKEELVGAIWGRLFSEKEKGYGFIDSRTPEISMAIKKSYRGKGVGTLLIKRITLAYVRLGITSLSLSVHKKNRAFHLYSRLGFEIVYEEDTSVIMKLEL